MEKKVPSKIMKYFKCMHLPPHLMKVSSPFCNLAEIMDKMPDSEEKQAGLRYLMNAKDCFVRARSELPE